MAQKTHVQLIGKVKPLFQPFRYKILYGGRAGLKSWSMARALIIKSTQSPLRVLCTREFQNSIKESVFKLLETQVELLGLQKYFKFTNNEITNVWGSQFIFKGLHNNVTSIKSMEGIDICWVEEAETVTNDSWSVLIPTIRKAGSEIWVSFNPYSPEDPVYERFVANSPPSTFVQKLSWEDNPWLTPEILAEKDYLKLVDPDAYLWVWEGMFLKRSKAQILADKIRVDTFTPGPTWNGPYYGIDWGFSNDPLRMVKCWVHDTKLYIQREVDGIGIDIDKIPSLLKNGDPDSTKYAMRGDSSRPETISYVRQHGFPKLVPCTKGSGSVDEGITFLRSFTEIVIDPSCTETILEAKLYKYKVVKLTGEILPEVVDKFNHSWDAVRYALEPLMPSRMRGTVTTRKQG